jgi:hypothetical protein
MIIFKKSFLSLFLWKKSNQKSHPKKIKSLFRDCALIKLFYYCEFDINK